MIVDINTGNVLIDDDGLPEFNPKPTTEDKELAAARYDAVSKEEVDLLSTWNRRYREYQEK